ncbi:MAG TPA: hypothetical protein VH643_31220 [Gemmataceae bacterium]|jgi:hypothetical protein
MSDASTQPAAFVGWYRVNRWQPWQPVVQAGSEGAALDKLLAYLPGDKIVLPADRDPNEREGRP